MLRYRRDIDGLRAIAVVPVVLFHAGLPLFSGGFIGVDVFFVISGYLITAQLMTAPPRWRAIGEFYERRIRRIAPAMLVFLLALLAATVALMPAVDTLRTAKNSLAALFFAANYRFYRQTGYFDVSADEEPLLHTWSLAVEEQYYLLFPVLLLALRRWGPRSVVPVLCAGAAGSLLLAQLRLDDGTSFSFYLLPGRAWELLAGAILAAWGVDHARRGAVRELLAGVGLLLIVVPIFAYDETTPFPGLAAVLPVLGAALLIATGERTRIARLLALRPMVAIGLISYSLYLWHWPILVLSRQVLGAPGTLATISLIAASFAAAYLSYRLVEQPFRNRARVDRRRLLLLVAITALLTAGVAAALVISGGWPGRSSRAEQWHRSTAAVEQAFQANPCLAMGPDLPPAAPCRLGTGGARVDGVLWGDSHAAHWAPMIADVAAARGLSFRQLTKAGCPPVAAAHMFPADSHRRSCPAFNRLVIDHVLSSGDIRYVVIAANWQGILEGDIRVGDQLSPHDLPASIAAARASLGQVAQQLERAGKIVIAIGQTPIPDENVILCIGRRRFIDADEASCSRSSIAIAGRRDAAATALLGAALPTPHRRLVSPLPRFCDRDACYGLDQGRPLYIDAAHLSPLGAKRLAADFAAALRDAGDPRLTPAPWPSAEPDGAATAVTR